MTRRAEQGEVAVGWGENTEGLEGQATKCGLSLLVCRSHQKFLRKRLTGNKCHVLNREQRASLEARSSGRRLWSKSAKKEAWWSPWLAQLQEWETLDLRIMSLGPMVGEEMTKNK